MAGPDKRNLPELPYPLDGRSLVGEEYIQAFLKWIRWTRLDARAALLDPGPREDEIRTELRQAIRDAETSSMLRRLGDGENWEQIVESALTGWRDPVRWV
jgi:hypothetical protein